MECVRERDQNETWTRNEAATERIWNKQVLFNLFSRTRSRERPRLARFTCTLWSPHLLALGACRLTPGPVKKGIGVQGR